MTQLADPNLFVASVRPLLAAKDTHGLTDLLRARWSLNQLTAMLTAGPADVRKVAAVCLSLVGDTTTVDPVCRLLADADPVVNQMAEHALWSIWFRAGTPEANHDLCRGVKALHRREFERAITHFDAAVAAVPTFAEAYNQRAIAHYLADRYELSIADCRKATRLVPCHFGAWAGMGHCFLSLSRFKQALGSYERALAINPHLDSLRQTAAEIRSRLGER
jgi:tetratricopeptide (TPR) repeat protein